MSSAAVTLSSDRAVSQEDFGVGEDDWNCQVTGVTFLTARQDWLVAGYRTLSRLAGFGCGWDGYDADPPNQVSVDVARNVMHIAGEVDVAPGGIDASAEGGVCISFQQGERYGDIECFNSGEIFAAVSSSGGEDTEVWEVDRDDNALRAAISRIRTFVGC